MKTSCAEGCKIDFGCVSRNWCCRGADDDTDTNKDAGSPVPLQFGTSQWKCGPPILFLLLHRLPWALFWLGYLIYDIQERISHEFYFEFVTKWNLFLVVLNALVGFIVAAIMQAGRMREKWNHFLGFYWVLWSTASATAPTVTLIFWAFIYDPAKNTVDFISIVTHVINTAYTLLDVMVVAIPLRAYHFYYAEIVATIYIIFSAIHEVTANKLIYPVFNFQGKPGSSVAFYFGGLVMEIAVWFCIFGLYKLRVFIAEKSDSCRRNKKVEDVETRAVTTNV